LSAPAEKAKPAADEVSATKAAEASAAEKVARTPGPGKVARAYFDAVGRRDIDAMAACWAPGGIENIVPVGELTVPDGMRAFFEELFAALPDTRMEVLDLVAARNQAAVRYRMTGTFCGAPFQGVEPTGARIVMEGIDLLTIEGGLIHRNDAYYDSLSFARQAGMMPPRESTAERRMTQAFNARTRVARSLLRAKVIPVADDVTLIQGGFPARVMNVYLIREADGVTIFDAGVSSMTNAIASSAAGMGPIKRVVLGHAHPDHRGAAAGLAAPVWCHEAEAADAEGDGGVHYFHGSDWDWFLVRALMPRLLRMWDGGPVKVEGTLREGDEVAGFQVVHLPGHAPGLIGLWRESDRLALVSDCFYTLDVQTGIKGRPRVPHRAVNLDTEQARASIRKLAALEPAAAWPGHANSLTGDVRGQLERAADET
jgi:glyoxylase-like metal-dependent hydrolase (beta-lactamase superfamily II)/ketosteroid isomerase-like protein